MSDFGSKKQLSASVSHGDVLPVSILREKTLPEILKKATAYETGIIWHFSRRSLSGYS